MIWIWLFFYYHMIKISNPIYKLAYFNGLKGNARDFDFFILHLKENEAGWHFALFFIKWSWLSFCFVLHNFMLFILDKYKKGMHVDVDSKVSKSKHMNFEILTICLNSEPFGFSAKWKTWPLPSIFTSP